jgi:hypothetical protein
MFAQYLAILGILQSGAKLRAAGRLAQVFGAEINE